MKRIHPLVIVLSALLLSPTVAMAADGYVCYSSIFTETGSPGSGTTTHPQLTNTTPFTCATTTPYTIKQLSALGLIITSVQTVAYSETYNTNGTYTSKSRIMLILQK